MRRSLILAMLLAVAVVASGAAAAPCTLRSATATKQTAVSQSLAVTLSRARLATAKYATDLAAAKAAGYGIITKMIPDMGFHFLNPKITKFDATKPTILVYPSAAGPGQLGALEWVFPSKPTKPPLPGATYGSFGPPATTRTARSSPRRPGRVSEDGAEDGRGVRLLAPGPRDAARVALVPESGRSVRGHEPARPPVQLGLAGRPCEGLPGRGGSPSPSGQPRSRDSKEEPR